MLPVNKAIRILVHDGPGEFWKQFSGFVHYRSRDAVRPIVDRKYDSIILDRDDLESISSELYELELASDLPSPREQRSLNPLESEEDSGTNIQPTYKFDRQFVAVVPEVISAGANGLAYTQSGKIIADTVDFDAHNEIFTVQRVHACLEEDIIKNPVLISSLLQTSSPFRRASDRYSRAAILHGKSHTYYQWMAYHLPKLRGIQRYSAITGNNVRLIIPSDPPSYVFESLELLGYGPGEYTEWQGGAVEIDELVVPTFPEPTPESINWLRASAFSNLDADPNGSDWIFISRQQADTRRIENFEEVSSLLEDFAVEIVELESLSLREQIQLFRGADGIIGPHGAGLINMIWGDDLSVIEIFGEVVDAPFFIIADLLEFDYTGFSGHQAEEGEINRNADIEIDIASFDALLQEKVAS